MYIYVYVMSMDAPRTVVENNKILTSHFDTQFNTSSDCRADFWEIVPAIAAPARSGPEF